MDADQIRQLKPKLTAFLKRFADCFARKDTRAHLPVYIRGQLSNLPDKSVEPIAIEAGVAPRTLQEFLTHLKWDHERMLQRVQETVRSEHAGRHALGIIDETSCAKKGAKTPGVQRQWCGSEGKKENCIVTVHLAYARADFHCLLDGELFLPESWSADRERCREAGIPDSLTYRPKWGIALELYDRASSNGLSFDWLTFDENYGGKPEFLRELDQRRQRFVAEVPCTFTGWLRAPRLATRTYHRHGRGRRRLVPRLAAGSRRARSVADLLQHPKLHGQPWKTWRVKDGEKGPMLWQVKHVPFYAKNEDRLPGKRWHLIVARSIMDPTEIKYFLSNAPWATPLETMLLVAFSRWRVERCFEDHKGEVGLDHYEGRKYIGLKRHLALSAVSYLFLARTRQEWGEKPGADREPTAHRHCRPDSLLVVQPACAGESGDTHDPENNPDPATQCRSAQEPHQADTALLTRTRAQTYAHPALPVARELAL